MDSGKSPEVKWRGTTIEGARRRLRFDSGVDTLPAPYMTISQVSWLGPTDDTPYSSDEDGEFTSGDLAD